jgi:cyanate permease
MKLKYFLISLLGISQLAGFFFIFTQQIMIGLICFGINGASVLLLILLLIKDRLQEKKEEEENDYSDY